jgi:hypothetical protein
MLSFSGSLKDSVAVEHCDMRSSFNGPHDAVGTTLKKPDPPDEARREELVVHRLFRGRTEDSHPLHHRGELLASRHRHSGILERRAHRLPGMKAS